MLQKYDIGDQWELSKCFDLIWSTNYSLLFKALPWYQVSYDLCTLCKINFRIKCFQICLNRLFCSQRLWLFSIADKVTKNSRNLGGVVDRYGCSINSVLIFAFSPLCGMIFDTPAAIPIFKIRLKLKNMFANIASYWNPGLQGPDKCRSWKFSWFLTPNSSSSQYSITG